MNLVPILIAFLILLVVIAIASFIGGYIMFNLAIKANSNKSLIFKHNSESEGAKEEKYLLEEKSSVYIYSKDNLKLHANIAENDSESEVFVILIHGYSGNCEDMENRAKFFFEEKGYSVLLPDLRGAGKSEGKYIGMGWLDRLDIVSWIEYINNNYPNYKIILYGVSMGAATVMMTLGEKLPHNVKVAIEDCGYSSVEKQFTHEIKKMFHLPKFPVLNMASIICKIKAGYSFKEASCINQLKNNNIPLLCIHGSEDNFVPTYMINEVYDSTQGVKEKLIVDNAKHGMSCIENSKLYWDTVGKFIENNIR